MKRLVGTTLATVVVAGGLVGATSAPAFAGCAPERGTKYTIYNKSTVYKGTNLASTWMDFRSAESVTVSYEDNNTASWNASGTAGIEAEAGVIFAKASTSFSVTIGKEWSKSKSWNYSMTAKKPKGKKQVRMRYFHEAKKFSVHKQTWVINGNCKTLYTTKWRKTIVGPAKRSSNDVWRLEYK
ncbi:hypothetical protein [Streptomyces capitiformicae]|uniref:Lipoprotein n=1 Tax=Streptomyces capitiformicae TaxID=2014920 RepID=A0A918Z0V2_9ACTN|nr:hypothetical protein [Streptomyces capitiformicae]GHE32717.1 hypothetical protein GCM10017771_49520 [Streptomyces capitiformicae]